MSEGTRITTIEPRTAVGLPAAEPARALPNAAASAADGNRQRFLMVILGVGIGLLIVAASSALPRMRVTYMGRVIADHRLPIVGGGVLLVSAVSLVLAASVP